MEIDIFGQMFRIMGVLAVVSFLYWGHKRRKKNEEKICIENHNSSSRTYN